jgi:hypothetical protein
MPRPRCPRLGRARARPRIRATPTSRPHRVDGLGSVVDLAGAGGPHERVRSVVLTGACGRMRQRAIPERSNPSNSSPHDVKHPPDPFHLRDRLMSGRGLAAPNPTPGHLPSDLWANDIAATTRHLRTLPLTQRERHAAHSRTDACGPCRVSNDCARPSAGEPWLWRRPRRRPGYVCTFVPASRRRTALGTIDG